MFQELTQEEDFHSAQGIPGSQKLPPSEREKLSTIYKKLYIVNRESGRVAPLEEEKEYHPGEEGVITHIKTPEERIKTLNNTEWDNSLFQVEVNRENAERIIQDVHPVIISRFADLNTGKLHPEEVLPEEGEQIKKVRSAFEFVQQARLNADTLFSKAYEFAKKDNDEAVLNALQEFSKKYAKEVGLNEQGKVKDPYRYQNIQPPRCMCP